MMNNATIALARIQCFSMFSRPITNKRPYTEVNLKDVHAFITSDIAKDETLEYRSITDDKARREYKAKHFDYCTFSGIFMVREDKAILQHSGLICLAFDHLKDVEATFEQLKTTSISTRFCSSEVLRATASNGSSPSSIRSIAMATTTSLTASTKSVFSSASTTTFSTTTMSRSIAAAATSRACFLPYDPNAYLNPSIK